jgi:hypothetical protein
MHGMGHFVSSLGMTKKIVVGLFLHYFLTSSGTFYPPPPPTTTCKNVTFSAGGGHGQGIPLEAQFKAKIMCS